MKNKDTYMKLNGNFETYEGLDFETDFHGRMGNRWQKLLETKQKLETQKELIKNNFDIMSGSDLMNRLYLK